MLRLKIDIVAASPRLLVYEVAGSVAFIRRGMSGG